MKVHVDKSRGIDTLIVEVLSEIKPTDPLRLPDPFNSLEVRRQNEENGTDQIPRTISRKQLTFFVHYKR